ncbi:MAG: HupE/UreJ family protein [Chloroflexota bacterium]
MLLRKRLLPLLLFLLIYSIPTLVFAHDGETLPANAFVAGITHPVLGLDHLLAMVCVGIVSAQIGGRAVWTVPATFVGVMALGGLLGIWGIGLLAVEIGIAVSVIVLGITIAAERTFPIIVTMIAVGLFAVFHGYAHGTEMPSTAEPLLYALGFLTGTAVIHIAGLFIGDISSHYDKGKLLLRISGGLIALVGIMFVFGIL